MSISQTVLILTGGTAVLSIVFGIRIAMRPAEAKRQHPADHLPVTSLASSPRRL